MSEQDDEQWITERLDGGGSCADDMRAAIARGYERGKAEGAASDAYRHGGHWGRCISEVQQIVNPCCPASELAAEVAKVVADRDRLAKRVAEVEANALALDAARAPDQRRIAELSQRCAELDELVRALRREDERQPSKIPGELPSRLAALEQRVGGIVETLWAEPDTETAEYRRRLAALRSPAPEVDGLRAQVAAAERSEDRLTREVLTARRERDEAMGVVRRYLAWLDGPDGPHALQAIVADMRALASGQPPPAQRGAEIERLRARIAGARRLHVGVATWLRQNAHDWPSTPGHTDTCFCCLKVRECDAWLAEKDAPDPRDAEIETLRAKLAEAERCAQESADIMRRARDRAESYCLRLGEAESQRDALRQHALKLDGLCERAAVLLGALGRDDHQLVRAIRSRGEVPR